MDLGTLTALVELRAAATANLTGRTVLGMTALWRATIDPNDIDRTFGLFLPGALALLRQGQVQANALGSTFLAADRRVQGVDLARLTPWQPASTPDVALSTSLEVTGRVGTKVAMRQGGRTALEAGEVALGRIAGLTVQATQQPIRQGLINTIGADQSANNGVTARWQRAFGSQKPSGHCKLCTMLVGRGAVYTEESVKFETHGDCTCKVVAVYGR